MKIAVVGSGAMGSLFGGRLSLAGADVVLYDVFREHVDAVNARGLSIEEAATGGVLSAHPRASADPRCGEGAAVLVIFVKSTTTEEVAGQFAKIAGPATIVLTLQNGLGNEEIVRRAFGAERTAAGVTSEGATFLGPGRIRHAGSGPTHLAMADGRNEKLAELCALMTAAGFETHIEQSVASLVWSKLVINVGINALTAILGKENGRLLDSPEVMEIMADLVAEAVAIARARGITLSYADPLATVYAVARRTGANRSSMLQDFDRGRATEIDFMNGAIVREAQRLSMAVPANLTVTRLVKARERLGGA